MEALRGLAILPGPRIGTQSAAASGMAVKIEDGDGYDRGTWAASVEALRQVGVLDGGALRDLARYHRPVSARPARPRRRRDGRRVRAGTGGRADRLSRRPADGDVDGDPYRTLGLARARRSTRSSARTGGWPRPTTPTPPARRRCRGSSRSRRPTSSWSAGRRRARPAAPARGPGRASAADPDRADATAAGVRRPGPSPATGGRGRRAGCDRGPARDGGRAARPGRRSCQAARPVRAPARRTPAATAARPASAGRTRGRRRGKATLGSTSYDDVDAGPFEPDWSGASWYGTTSGTYWTLNPKEYADPRKHGPEYQARARRATGARPDARR